MNVIGDGAGAPVPVMVDDPYAEVVIRTVRCLSCKYDLTHLPEHRCPECGREFDPDDSAYKHPWRRYLLRVLRYTVSGLLVLAIPSIALYAYLFFTESARPPDPDLPYIGTRSHAMGVAGTAVMIVYILFSPIVAMIAMFVAWWKRCPLRA